MPAAADAGNHRADFALFASRKRSTSDDEVPQGRKGRVGLGQRHRHRQGAESFTEEVTRTIKGKEIKRKASKDEPAYLVEQEDGGRALKSHSELRKAS